MSAAPTPAPPYARIKQALKDGLASGEWSAGEQMPSESELVSHFGVSRMTVNRALKELQAEGLVQRVQGVGTFAARLHRVSSTLTIRDLHEEIESRGHRHHARVHEQRRMRCSAAVASALGLAPGASAFHTVIVHHENGVPVQVEDRWVNPDCSPGYLDHDFTRITPTQVLFDTTELWRAHYTIQAEGASAREATLLQVEPGEACLVITRSTHTRDATITQARLVHPGTRWQLQGEFKP